MIDDALERVDSLERVNSVEPEKEKENPEFDTCPGDLRYVFTFLDKKKHHFDYILKKDKPLPYERVLKGK